MSTQIQVITVPPRSGRREALLVSATIIAILTIGAALVQARQVDNFEPRLFGWQISSFYDLNPTDQAVYNALVTASDELWWIYGGRIEFPEPGKETWPSVAELNEEFGIAPFVKDLAWSQQGKVEWQRIAAFSFEGSSVYYGASGQIEEQGAYLLVLSHQHKGASYADGATMWIHPDRNAPPPTTIKTDSLIINGWKEIIPYNGAAEVQRLKGA